MTVCDPCWEASQITLFGIDKMQAPSTDFISAFCYGSTLQSTINAANLLRAQTGKEDENQKNYFFRTSVTLK